MVPYDETDPLPPDGQRMDSLRSALRAALSAGAPDRPEPGVAVLARDGQLARFCEGVANGSYRYAAPWREVLDLLAAIGGVDLSLARLMEGHLNALQLVSLHGSAEQQARALATARDGGMLGVWGADGAVPLRFDADDTGARHLAGGKRYASGAGLLRLAVVPVGDPMHLLLLDVGDPARVDPRSWNMRGMRRSISGAYDFTGLAATDDERMGEADDYRREPFFVGGIWRCAAAQLGAIEAIVSCVATELARNGRDQHPLQMERIGKAIVAGRTARLWIEDAARRVETAGPDAQPEETSRTVALSAYARLVTEEAAMTVIALAERALGLGAFALDHPAEALMRDLAVYIRQANPDAVLLQHGRVLARDWTR